MYNSLRSHHKGGKLAPHNAMIAAKHGGAGVRSTYRNHHTIFLVEELLHQVNAEQRYIWNKWGSTEDGLARHAPTHPAYPTKWFQKLSKSNQIW